MNRIVTITLNPTIDKSILVPSLIENQKLLSKLVKSESGGGGINISRAIKNLSGSSTALFFAGGFFGSFFIHLFNKKKIDFKTFLIKNETRESLIIFDELSSKQYLLSVKGPIVSEKEWQPLLCYLSNLKNVSFIVASGSLPPGVPIDFYARMAKIVKKIGAKFILDTSGEPLQLAIREGIYLIKPNLREMGMLVGIEKIEREIAKVKAIEIIKQKKCEVIVISLGADGALLVTEEFVEHFLPPKIEVRSTVGAGDSMLAGIVLKLSKNKSLQQAVRYGVACGSAATMHSGTSLCNKKDVNALIKAFQ